MTIIYADLTLLVNTALNYLVFCCTMRLSGLPLRHLRIFGASVLGGVYAVFAAIPTYDILTAFLAKCMASLLMARVAFGKDPWFLRRYLLFLAASCTLSGACVAVQAVLATTTSPMVVFLLSGVFCAFVLAVVFHRAGNPATAAATLTATIRVGERQVTVPLLRDTGNTLRCPETGQVVCVVWEKALEPLGQMVYRKIPFQSLGESAGELECFVCDSITIGERTWEHYPIGVARQPLSDGGGFVGLWGGDEEGVVCHAGKTL